MATHPPYSQIVYLQSAALTLQVVKAQSPTSKSNLQTDCISTNKRTSSAMVSRPVVTGQNQFFVKLESQRQLVLKSPRVYGEECFLNVQGDFHVNGSIQTWTIKPYQNG